MTHPFIDPFTGEDLTERLEELKKQIKNRRTSIVLPANESSEQWHGEEQEPAVTDASKPSTGTQGSRRFSLRPPLDTDLMQRHVSVIPTQALIQLLRAVGGSLVMDAYEVTAPYSVHPVEGPFIEECWIQGAGVGVQWQMRLTEIETKRCARFKQHEPHEWIYMHISNPEPNTYYCLGDEDLLP